MKKFLKQLFPRHKWWSFTLMGVIFFVVFHVSAFGWYKFLIYRYEKLYDQATTEGSLIEMPADFQRVHNLGKERSILTRPDILAREASVIQSGIRSLVVQYRTDMYRLRDTVVQDIEVLRTVGELSAEYIFPQRVDILQLASTLESELASEHYTRVDTMQALARISQSAAKRAVSEFDLVQKEVLLRDILGLKYEIKFLDSFYRVTSDTALTFSYKNTDKQFRETFTSELLRYGSVDSLRKVYSAYDALIQPYRAEAAKMRAEARLKRAELVAKEREKWTDTPPPPAPIGHVYTQIAVSLRYQMMYVYEDGDLILSTPITSGRRDFETIRGTFQIYTKQRNKLMKSPFPDEEYELWVDYWMAFYGAYGIHDTCNSKDCWRTRFGGSSYIYSGSHGCVNTPYNAVRFIYNWSRIGTTVHVY
jgi:lipoprotein-anchoring transpeptidase ErfK/SrfK